jgi:peptidoglycan DL-endopeptidase CwlO
VYGAAGPNSFDCSGLTMWAWAHGGVSLPHSSSAQYAGSTHIPISAIQPGDLLFYYSDIHHVAMYVGGGMMIEAPHTGANVREVPMRTSDLVGAGRVG